MFDSYEADFRYLIRSIKEKLEGTGRNLQGGMYHFGWWEEVYEAHHIVLQRKGRLRLGRLRLSLTRRMISYVQSITNDFIIHENTPSQVSQLEIEIQGIPTSVRRQYTASLKQAKADLIKYRKVSKEAHAQAAHTDLLGGFRGRGATGGTSDDPYGEQSDRTRLLAGTEALNDGSRRLADSTSLALETETYGADILRSLRGQREQIENARDTVSCPFLENWVVVLSLE